MVGAFTHHQILKNLLLVPSTQYPVLLLAFIKNTNFYVWWGTPTLVPR
ncbi:hypothetical protein COO91_04078 [Nostoc flagelliforme CCNUN1]|uniref:Uncharacterized protein n=1 Tax=Nostoc flagelliforme CCNUN1 TaxID=2038116 RepID=A0A2K8STK3_9NOSO|nr:hypothetical protein COO91_04078 [Nostoc flagelliforme CCNUN1]